MHRANAYINTLFPGIPAASVITSHVLNHSEATRLQSHLQNDAVSYIYSSAISIGDAIRGIQEELLTWATVKSYYATFYACRALLALDGVCIFYIGTKPFAVEAKPGNLARKAKGRTHEVILTEFETQNTVPYLLSQDIESIRPLDWLMEKREEANYRNAKFWEPTIPKHFEKIVNIGVRQAIQAYLSDTTGLYLFDADHAILAYPIKTLEYAYQKMRIFKSLALSSDEISCLRQLFRDKSGPIPEIHNMLGT